MLYTHSQLHQKKCRGGWILYKTVMLMLTHYEQIGKSKEREGWKTHQLCLGEQGRRWDTWYFPDAKLLASVVPFIKWAQWPWHEFAKNHWNKMDECFVTNVFCLEHSESPSSVLELWYHFFPYFLNLKGIWEFCKQFFFKKN